MINVSYIVVGLGRSNYRLKAEVLPVAHSFCNTSYKSNTMKEIWKDIPNYKGIYKVSNLGFIKNKNGIIKGGVNIKGYKTIQLWKSGKYKSFAHHQLVAMAFLGHVPNGNTMVVDHINNINTDNRLENLQIITNRENSIKDRHQRTNRLLGAYFNTTKNQWYSRIKIDNKDVYLGTFKNELECHEAYKKAYNGRNVK